MAEQFLLNFHWIRFRTVNFIHRYNYRHIGCTGVLNCFNCLRLNFIIRGDHKYNDISDICSSGTHRGKSLVSWCIEECNPVSTCLQMICANVLGNAASFTSRDTGFPDFIEQRSFPVINMSHDCHNRCANFQICCIWFIFLQQVSQLEGFHFNCHVKICGNQFSGFTGDCLVDCSHNAESHQFF